MIRHLKQGVPCTLPDGTRLTLLGKAKGHGDRQTVRVESPPNTRDAQDVHRSEPTK